MTSPPALLAVGRVAKAHGIRGRILVAPYNAGSDGLQRATRLWLSRDGAPQRCFEVAHAERVNLGYLVALRGVSDRNGAEALRGSEVLADRAELPPLAEDELYAIDLVGYTVVDAQGVERGVVEGLESAGPQELLRLRGGTLVPFGLVRSIEEGRVVIEAPEGLFDLE